MTVDSAAEKLLQHYKDRIDEFDKERAAMLDSLQRCAVQQDKLHALQWENRTRAQEVQELQKALSDAHGFLFEERQRLLALQAENDELKLQELQDRKRIQQLLAMTQPYEQELTYDKAGAPQTITLQPAAATQQQRQKEGGAAGARVMRTVFLPTADADVLTLRVESLQAQLAEQTQVASERIAALLEDRKVREQEWARHRANYELQLRQLTDRLKRTEESLRQITKECILAKCQMQEAQTASATAAAELQQQRQESRAEVVAVQRQAEQQLKQARQESDGKMREYVDKFRQQVRQREEELAQLAAVHAAAKEQYEKRASELEGRCARLAESVSTLELRRARDVEGCLSDVSLLRKQLQAVDRKLLQMRLVERLEDDERLDRLLDQLGRKVALADDVPAGAGAGAGAGRPAAAGRRVGPQRPSSSGGASVKSVLSGKLQQARGRLAELEEELQHKRTVLRRRQ